MDRHNQLSQRTRSDVAFPVLEVSYCALTQPGSPGKALRGELSCFCPDLIEIFRVGHSLVLAAGLVRRVQCSRVSQHGRIRPARPAGRRLFAEVMELTGDDMPTRKQADGPARAYAAVWSAELA